MKQNKYLQELVRWLYVTVVGIVLALFFTLLLDGFCFLAFNGWQPLLGPWPIFSGSVGVVYFGNGWSVLALVIGLGSVGRIMLGDREPVMLSGWAISPGVAAVGSHLAEEEE